MSFVGYQIGLTLALLALSVMLMQSRRRWAQRVGTLLLMVSTGVGVWFLTDNVWVGVGGFLAWIIVPVLQAGYMTRRLQLNKNRKLESGYLDGDDFPVMDVLSAELRKLGFQGNRDYWLRPSHMEQGYRIFTHTESATSAAVAVIRQGIAVLHYIIFLTRAEDGRSWMTWDYPLAYGLHMPEDFVVHRCVEAESIAELHEQHVELLKINEVNHTSTTLNTAQAEQAFEHLFRSTLEHNLKVGLLSLTGKDHVRYTWRGTFFVTWQVLKEVVLG